MFSIQVFLPASLLVVGLIVPYPGRGPLSADEEVEYLRDVHPILAERCFACHGAEKQKGGLRLDLRSGLFESDDPEWIPVVPGRPQDSALYELITLSADDPDVMPAKGDPLTKQQIATLGKWIEEGAPWEVAVQPSATGGSGVDTTPLIQALLAETEGAPRVDFDRDVRPILSENCFQCHGPDEAKRKADLRLDTRAGLFSRNRPDFTLIAPGDPIASGIAYRIIDPDPEEVMPPPESGHVLDEEEKRILVRWIEEGARWEEHWAFRALVLPERPALKDEAWPLNEIDRFVLARLEAEGLRPSPEADRFTLLRRATLDLTGLPPTPEEVEAFVADEDPGAYERVVDRLLDSPRYGEHMARFWLDAARYGDTHGLHLDNYRETWPYRDWVIGAFNRDIPYDQFIVEQLAGDLLPDATLDQKVASGFNRCHVTTAEGGSIEEEVYVRNVVDRASTFGTVFMGLTVGCAVCHDHKFDPISQREFYGLFGFFNNIDGKPMDGNAKAHAPVVSVPTAEQTALIDRIQRELEGVEEEAVAILSGIEYREPEPATEGSLSLTTTVWVDDDVPAGSIVEGDGLSWVDGPTAQVRSGVRSTRRSGAGRHQHLFRGADRKLRIAAEDVLYAWVFLDPEDPPRELMLQFLLDDGSSWNHRAYWGENLIDWGADGTGARRAKGELPATGEWVRLEVGVEDVSLGPGMVVNGIAFTQFDGTVWWDDAGIDSTVAQAPEDHDWIDDEVPRGAVLAGDGPTWNWVGGEQHPVLSGTRSLRRSGGGGLNQDYFTQAGALRLSAGDRLYAHAWLDPQDPPRSIQLQFNDGTWEHRARWGDTAHGAGRQGGADHRAGELPTTGEWVRLEVPMAAVGLKPGADLNGWAFTQVGGTVYWDRAGINTWSPPDDRHLTSQRSWEAIAAVDSTIPQGVREAAAITREARTEAHLGVLRAHYLRHVHGESREVFDPLNTRVEQFEEERKGIEGQIATTPVMKERTEPRPAYILKRGQYDARGEEVARSTPSMLPPMKDGLPRDRLGLARWLVDPNHPLTARVTVNRFWQQLFGVGLVETSEDFGNQGERPSHPELLDWLATSFIADGWRVKALQKQIIMSSTYCQCAADPGTRGEGDPQNRLMARGPRFRLDAETLRDQALALSGLLVERIGGPSVKPPQPAGLWYAVGYTSSNTARFKADEGAEKVHRRALYTFLKRTSPPPQMSTFDAPSREECCVRRERTNTPLQALLLMNDPQYVETAAALAGRIVREGGASDEDRAEFGLSLVLCRPPSKLDVADVIDLLLAQKIEYEGNPLAARQLLSVRGPSEMTDGEAVELASWMLVANLLLNLDEVVVKG